MYKPKVAMLDEPDSGLDVDGIAVIGKSIARLAQMVRQYSSQHTMLRYYITLGRQGLL